MVKYSKDILDYIRDGQHFTGKPDITPDVQNRMFKLGLECDRRRGYFPVEDGKKYLNIGCGFHHIPGYINIDKDEQFEPDIVCDVLGLKSLFEENSIAGIVMIHSLPYLSWWQVHEALKMFFTLLEPKGQLLLQHCSLENLLNGAIVGRGNLKAMMQIIQGLFACDIVLEDAHIEYDYAKIIWPTPLLAATMAEFGFTNIQMMYFAEPFDKGWRDVIIVGGKDDKIRETNIQTN